MENWWFEMLGASGEGEPTKGIQLYPYQQRLLEELDVTTPPGYRPPDHRAFVEWCDHNGQRSCQIFEKWLHDHTPWAVREGEHQEGDRRVHRPKRDFLKFLSHNLRQDTDKERQLLDWTIRAIHHYYKDRWFYERKTGEEYVCAVCRGSFVKEIPDSEAIAEMESFGTAKEDCGIICDDCWKKMYPDRN